MGSGSSRLGSSHNHHHHHHHHHHQASSQSSSSSERQPRRSSSSTSKVNHKHRPKLGLASFICGASTSSQREDFAAASLVDSLEVACPTNESILTSDEGTGFTSRASPRSEPGASSESSSTSIGHTSAEDDSDIETSSKRKCLSDSDEVVPHHAANAERKCYQPRASDILGAPCTGHASLGFSPNRLANDVDLVGNNMPTSPAVPSSSVQPEELEVTPRSIGETHEVTGSHISDSGSIPVSSDPVIASQSHGDEAIQELIRPGLGLLVSDRAQARPEGSVLHVDVVSISSDILPNINNEISTREARRNSRRMFWDAFSSRSSRRHADFPAIILTSEDADLMGSRRRWLLDIGDAFFDDEASVDSWRFGRRSRMTTERRRNSRSEFWDRLQGAATESSHRSSCPFDMHPDGSCSCEFDEASALTSVSRIVLLAEALFEVLDEIHRQPEAFSLSMLSVPAPVAVVDSLPSRTYEKPVTANRGDDADQCYICLVEYEKGDKIRVLPCQHEYHMACVDKWLKEVHGVCPLCRGDVRGVREGAASSSVADLT